MMFLVLFTQGRFHHVLHVPLPDAHERALLLQYFATKCHLDANSLAPLLREGMSGADIENLCREATLQRHRSEFHK
jgi:SpoVK/Ycf46/Vps4 family AAA+-type ATPase